MKVGTDAFKSVIIPSQLFVWVGLHDLAQIPKSLIVW